MPTSTEYIFLALFLSVLLALSSSGFAWLLDPAVKKIFIEQNRTLAWLIPLAIVFAFATKGITLYFARMIIIRVAQEICGEIQKKISANILYADIKTLDKASSKDITFFNSLDYINIAKATKAAACITTKQLEKLENRIEFLQDRLLELATRTDIQDALLKLKANDLIMTSK